VLVEGNDTDFEESTDDTRKVSTDKDCVNTEVKTDMHICSKDVQSQVVATTIVSSFTN